MTAAYATLTQRFHRLGVLRETARLLHWDSAAVMPDGAAGGRAEQLATLDLLCHEIETAPDLAELLDAADGEAGALDGWDRANLSEMRRAHVHASALDPALVEALSKAVAACEMTWRDAKASDDFAAVRPALGTVLDLTREAAAAKGAALGVDPYDALLDDYEPGLTAARVDPLFDDLAAFLPGFLDQVLDRQASGPAPLPLPGPFPREAQERLARRFMDRLGFDFQRGRLDQSHHPFCGGVPDDVRITTRYAEDSFFPGLMAVLHETGHALYEGGRPRAWRYQPVGLALGMAVHESQSLLIEMQICRGADFLAFAAPIVRAELSVDGPAFEAENLSRHSTWVDRGLIRVDADEATYPAHVIQRYRLERALIAGDLTLADLPGAWSDGLHALLGVRPDDDRAGCLQDIHWYHGAFGYFPTYTLGAMTAAQLRQAAEAALPDLADQVRGGDFRGLTDWLRTHVHTQGRRRSADALLTEVTGRPLDPTVFRAHLEDRYLHADAGDRLD